MFAKGYLSPAFSTPLRVLVLTDKGTKEQSHTETWRKSVKEGEQFCEENIVWPGCRWKKYSLTQSEVIMHKQMYNVDGKQQYSSNHLRSNFKNFKVFPSAFFTRHDFATTLCLNSGARAELDVKQKCQVSRACKCYPLSVWVYMRQDPCSPRTRTTGLIHVISEWASQTRTWSVHTAQVYLSTCCPGHTPLIPLYPTLCV